MAGAKDEFDPVAEEVFLDNSTIDCVDTAENVQEGFEEICTVIGNSASPGYSFGRSGNVSSGTFLLNEGVPSNKSGHKILVSSPVLRSVSVASEDIDTYDISVYEHDGDSINLTLLTTVSIVAARGGVFSVNVATSIGKQLATRITSGSAKNLVVDVALTGSI